MVAMKQGAEIPMNQWIRRARRVARLKPEGESEWLATAEGKAWYVHAKAAISAIGKAVLVRPFDHDAYWRAVEAASEVFKRCEDSDCRAWFMTYVNLRGEK